MVRGKRRNKVLRQSSLFNLKGVVVLEEVERDDKRLNDETVSEEEKVAILRRLHDKTPSTKVITETGIGRTVRRLSKDPRPVLSRQAKKVFIKWKAEVERREELKAKGPKEVACDEGTQLRRQTARRVLAAAVKGQEGLTGTIAAIEKEVFDQNKHLVDSRYNRIVKRLAESLKREESHSRDLKSGELRVKAFVHRHLRS